MISNERNDEDPPPPPRPSPQSFYLPSAAAASMSNLLDNSNALRSSYVNVFNQILDNSINVNCICKTTKECSPSSPASRRPPSSSSSSQSTRKKTRVDLTKVFDRANDNHFMSGDEDDHEQENAESTASSSSASHANDVFMGGGGGGLADLDVESDALLSINNCRINKICDLSCFENMKYVNFALKNCFVRSDLAESELKFEHVWNSFKFLRKYPKSCDYYGTTIFHLVKRVQFA